MRTPMTMTRSRAAGSDRRIWVSFALAAVAAAGTLAQASSVQATGVFPPPAHAPLKEYKFPDGTGSIGVAEGWHSNSPSCMKGYTVQGPADQLVSVAAVYSGVTPNSPIRSSASLVAPLTTPVEALRIVVPQLSRMSTSHGGPAIAVDDLVERQSARPISRDPKARASLLTLSITETRPDGEHHYKAMAKVELLPISTGSPVPTSWMMTVTTLRAPDATFDHDLPLMMQMSNALQENKQVIFQKNQQILAAKKQRFDQQQGRLRQQQQSFDSYLKGQEKASNDRMRQADNADEYIRGTRTVVDTRTGERRSVDLGDVDRTVDKLNKNGSRRYRQVPLRDEADPRQ